MGHPVGDFPSYCEFDTFFPTKILDIPAPIWISFPNLQITVETAAAAVPPHHLRTSYYFHFLWRLGSNGF